MLAALALLLLLVIALLAIPVNLAFQLSWQNSFSGQLSLWWAFGLVRARLASPPATPPSPHGAATAAKTHPKDRHSRHKSYLFRALRQRPFRERSLRFITELWCAFRKHDVRLRIRIGLGDPADTGQLWAVIGPVAGMLYTLRDASVAIEPEFHDSTLELDGSGNIRFIPLQLLGITLALLLSPAIWRGIAQMRKASTP